MLIVEISGTTGGPVRQLTFDHQRWRSVPRRSPWIVYRLWGALAINSGVAEYAKPEVQPEPPTSLDTKTYTNATMTIAGAQFEFGVARDVVMLEAGGERIVHQLKADDTAEEATDALIAKASEST